MRIGILRVEMRIPGCRSLKEKRSIIKRHINRLQRQFNISIAEIDNHDNHGFCTLGIVTIHGKNDSSQKTLDRIISELEQSDYLQLYDYCIEII